MKLGVIGTGYVGLVAGAGFADFGNDVVCVDIDAARIERLRRGEMPLHEPHLQDLVRSNMQQRRLSFTTDVGEAVRDADVVFIAVGTPSLSDGNADLSQVLAAASAIGHSLNRETVVVTKSTVPVGTADLIRETIERACDRPFAVAANPEFLKEGSAVEDFLRPMRVIVGIGRLGRPITEAEQRARTTMRRLYEPVVRTNDRLIFTDTRSAEMTKYAANAYLATRISFINDIAALCERTGADVEMVRRGMGMDSRIGPKFLFPGIGFGGSCFPKDVRALLATAQRHGMDLPIVSAAYQINERQKTILFDKMVGHFGGLQSLRGRTVAVWGLSFKPETDDIREAPALALIERLHAAGASIRASDPVALHNAARRLEGRAELLVDPYEAARGADALVLCTEWRQYRQPNFRRLRELMAGNGIFDGRNIWDGEQLRELGFRYHAIGRPQPPL
ncbi:MAG: UDP-glucose/GDP-mannose dehydrogenase family protein [Myxococcales bacterium]|nr:UDP-glucose/GDP-mannose dehydrogenase family protein [Myxococcota bacterium]MDW8282769.1 UDP-glucose/GDP-mannose dehydrogenase family protein [Myxococcales bacterium]